ncbi:MAG: tRNA (guanosine(46)-N7)-methyltransferase TrmB [Pseudomonadota bacterium]
MTVGRPLRTFGRTGGRALSARQQALIDGALPKLAVPNADDGTLDPLSLFSDDISDVWLEIGFGGGEHMTGQAARRRDTGFIGCEPFIEGMAKALGQIDDAGLTNIRLHMDDARPVIERLTADSVAQVFILFPDPWPKKRQQKRRLIQPAFLDRLARIVRPGGRVRFATDVRSYADEALYHFTAHGAYRWTATRAADWRVAPPDHLTTRYEAKALGDCAPVWFDFEVLAPD